MKNGPIPEKYATYALGPIEITMPDIEILFSELLKQIYGFQVIHEENHVKLLENCEGGHGGQVILWKIASPRRREKAMVWCTMWHFVFMMMKQLKYWENRYNQIGIFHSGLVDRFYFGALYARISGILIELSTDGPGFETPEEPYVSIWEKA